MAAGMIPINQTDYKAVYYDKHANGTPIESPPVGMLLHEGAGTQASDLHILTGKDPSRKVGCHYYVNRKGTIYQLCPDTYAPWHAGAMEYVTTRWWGASAAAFGIVNGNRLLGVESEHRIGQDWPAAQLTALALLFRDKIATYAFPLQRIGAHKWFAPRRKADPTNWTDADLQAWFRDLYRASGSMYEVTAPAGARIRQGPGVTFPIAETIPAGYRFWSDTTLVGEDVNGINTWVHFAGPTQTIVNPLGFVWAGILTEVATP